jgi:hypothetical protein
MPLSGMEIPSSAVAGKVFTDCYSSDSRAWSFEKL